MTGILLIFVLLVWIAICLTATYIVGRILPRRWWTGVVKVLLFFVILPLPVSDELAAASEFRAICHEKAVLVLDDPLPRGKTVWFSPVARTNIKVGSLDAELQRWTYVETSSGRSIYHFHILTVTGGWLVKALGISETSSPIFLPSSCAPKELHDIDIWKRRLGITEIPKLISKRTE